MKKKTLKILVLGIVIWSMSLLWPEVNQVLTVAVEIGLLFGLIALVLLYVIWKQGYLKGLFIKEISHILHLSPATVKTH
jgi:hypothetical protein